MHAHAVPPILGATDDTVRSLAACVQRVVGRDRRVTAEDCEDAALWALSKAFDTNPCVHNLTAWLVTVACNRARSMRKGNISRERTMERFARSGLLDSATVTPLHTLAREDASRLLAAALRSLSDPSRTVVQRHHLDGDEFAVIARDMGVSEGTVKMLALRARRRMGAILSTDPRIF